MSDTPLAPCPFCGSAPRIVDYYGNYNHPPYWVVHCDSCDISLDGKQTPAEAVALWNTRPTNKEGNSEAPPHPIEDTI